MSVNTSNCANVVSYKVMKRQFYFFCNKSHFLKLFWNRHQGYLHSNLSLFYTKGKEYQESYCLRNKEWSLLSTTTPAKTTTLIRRISQWGLISGRVWLRFDSALLQDLSLIDLRFYKVCIQVD
jgi:hypothetical protein